MEAVYLKELKNYSVSETMNFREKYLELVNKNIEEKSFLEDGMEVDSNEQEFQFTTVEKIRRKHDKILADVGRKKSKTERKEMPALLPLHVPESSTSADAINYDLKPGHDVAFVFKVYPPFTYDPQVRCPKIRPNMEIVMLGHQTLNMLCDKIVCRDAYMEAGGDISNTPDIPVRMRLGEKYKSRMLYIGNTFYIDRSEPSKKDYSETIRRWGQSHNIEFGETLDMHEQTCLDLVARIGFPYVFQHLGGCEHLFRIEYARLIESKDCLESRYYPFYNYLARTNPKASLCMACLEVSQWIIFNSPRMISNPSFLCNPCFRSYHYIDGKKVGSFSAVRYWDCPLFTDTFDAVVENQDNEDEDAM